MTTQADNPKDRTHDAYRELIATVRACEADWRLLDRIDLTTTPSRR